MSGQGQKQEYGDFMLVMAVVFILFFAIFAKYAFYYYLYFWKAIAIPLFFILQYIPGFISDILFMWAPSGIEETSKKIFSLLISQPNQYFVDNLPKYKVINAFMNSLFRPYLIIMFLYSAWVIINKRSFKRRFFPIENKKKPQFSKSAIDVLLEQEAAIWPSVQLMIHEHPEKEGDIDKGKWAMSQRPEMFVKRYKLVDEFTDEYDNTYYRLNEERTFKLFNTQMGKIWNGFNGMSKTERHLFAIMAPKIMRDTDESKKINGLVAISYTSGKRKFSPFGNKADKELEKLVEKTLQKYMNEEKIKNIVNRHFYKKTVFAALLEAAREDGVLASCEFLWLKTVDRDMWYILNNVGRKSSHTECAAPWAHFLAEKALERKIANPMVSNAIIALDQYLFDTSYKFEKIYKNESENND
jgi:hypothetical protein